MVHGNVHLQATPIQTEKVHQKAAKQKVLELASCRDLTNVLLSAGASSRVSNVLGGHRTGMVSAIGHRTLGESSLLYSGVHG
jgi:hypothetical protein